ncbi:hypothetical protein MC885_003684 [Smutsia gigantea]|nr:hypothetical protein MC885_003684 [Smutsia gigantea]
MWSQIQIRGLPGQVQRSILMAPQHQALAPRVALPCQSSSLLCVILNVLLTHLAPMHLRSPRKPMSFL